MPEKPAGGRVMQREAQLWKNQVCKVFALQAPRQSGETPHAHDYTQIWYVTRGSCAHHVEGQEYTMTAGDAFILPPNIQHRTVLGPQGGIICCEFCMERLGWPVESSYRQVEEATRGLSFTMLFHHELFGAQPRFVFSPRGQREAEALMHTMLEEYERAEVFYEDSLRLRIMQLLLVFAREYTQSPTREKADRLYTRYRGMVQQTVRYIDENYAQPLTLEEVCRVSAMSKTNFCYLFKLLTGQTFVEYLLRLRIDKAGELLRQTDLPVLAVGQEVGFQDQAHFSRTFKRLKGVSPRQYRG